jgi:hypothetical protein
MKSFSEFLSEAKVSKTREQAEKLKVHHVGRGRYANEMGQITYKSENGALKKLQTPIDVTGQQAAPGQMPAQQASAPQDPNAPESGMEVNAGGPSVTITFGRFNPPTIGHEKLINQVGKLSQGGDLRIYPSRTQDPKKNPLDPATKIAIMKKMFPDYADAIQDNEDMKNIFDVLTAAYGDGYGSVNIVVGSDRVGEFDAIAKKYNGKMYNFEEINVLSAGERDADAEGVEGMSASKMRKASADNDFETFKKGMPKTINDSEARGIMTSLRKAMNIKEDYKLWEIAPKLDYLNLRENYFKGNIFEVGTIVENINTGIVGRIVNRGTNHVIYVDEHDEKYRGWLKDLVEVTEGADPRTQMEVGTDKYREYVQSLTPGQPVFKFSDFRNINNKKTK